MSALDLRSLLELLHQREVRFVVIGGVAVAAHGYVRGTADLDLVPDPDPENLQRVAAVLSELKSTLPTAKDRRFDPTSDAGVIRRGGNVTADTDLGIPVRVCSLTRLREMKEVQGRPQDRADLANLPES